MGYLGTIVPSSAPQPAQSPRPSVMIVEDEALIAMSLEDVFEAQGYRVTGPFSTCADALAALASAAPDIAILDATLKDGSCLELARELRGRDIPFLIYSGRKAIEEHAPELGGIPWVDKPAPSDFVFGRAVKLLDVNRPEPRA